MPGIPTRSGAPPAPADAKLGLVLDGKYRIIKKLGEGGMGSVYEGVHELIGKRVAIKTLNPEFAKEPSVVERFRREARAATAAGNEHIIEITDMGDLPGGSPFLVMEYLDGHDFGRVLEKDGALSIGRTVRIVRQVCDALAAAHGKGIVHRDLKPENIYLVPRKGNPEFVKVLDFGISKMREASEGVNKSLTSTGMALGTPHYMSPEQAQGHASTDHRTDVYALGVILYYALTGYTPFDSQTYVGLVVQIVGDPAKSMRRYRTDIPAELDAIVLRCLAKKPEERFRSVEELADALAPFEQMEAAPAMMAFGATDPPPAVSETLLEGGGANAKGPTEVGGHTNPQSGVRPYTGVSTEGVISGESVLAAPATKSKRLLVFAAAGALVLGAAAIVAMWGGDDGDAATPTSATNAAPDPIAPPPPVAQAKPEPAAPPVAAQPSEVNVRITATPSDAKIFLGDVEFSNPMNAPRLRSLDPVTLRIEREGFESIERKIVLDSSQSLEFALKEVAAAAAKPQRSAAAGAAKTTKKEETKSGRFRDDF